VGVFARIATAGQFRPHEKAEGLNPSSTSASSA
jgi:hypothetical protein